VEAKINPNRLIGVEIEIVTAIVGVGDNMDVQRLLADILTRQGLHAVARGYSHESIPAGCLLAVEHDTSLRDESRFPGLRWSKLEVKTAALPWPEIERILPPTLEIVNYLGARCNTSTGLHVHHHLPEVVERPEVVRNLSHLWWRSHKVIYGMVAPSRRANTYCVAPSSSDATRFDNVRSFSDLCSKLQACQRYSGLNLTNLSEPRRQTVEWRTHHGTTDWSKISAWLLATQRWVEHAVARNCHYKPEPLPNTREALNALLVATGLKINSRIYSKIEKPLRQAGRFLLKRWKSFNQPQDHKGKAVAA